MVSKQSEVKSRMFTFAVKHMQKYMGSMNPAQILKWQRNEAAAETMSIFLPFGSDMRNFAF